jgi:hypothetical protein
MLPTARMISSVGAEMVVLSSGAGYQQMDLILIDRYSEGEEQGSRCGGFRKVALQLPGDPGMKAAVPHLIPGSPDLPALLPVTGIDTIHP